MSGRRGGGVVSQHALGRGWVCIPACIGQGGVCPGGVSAPVHAGITPPGQNS